ncbi:hypothetical protein [Phenylobacterium sp.]|uniref:tetratricopeptide repeat protein n=1 Tax=Phenylobacterium sp. TaxID=1871053 RepID=UPI00120B2139|nr:hypothetical protein [Phenylobacterium sp.]THD55995.1 MAG: hypothetical protein E8A12_15285 [Phenylobacterium sp.]
MGEEISGPEAELDAGLEAIRPATAIALGLRKGGRKRDDPKLDVFLDEQIDLIRLQKEDLSEQRELVLSRLRLGRWKDRVSLALQAMTTLVGVLVAGAVAVMAWQAHEARGLLIAPFSVPSDFVARGLTGQVVAARIEDRLAQLQAETVSTRPASTYANDWGNDIKVEIPETGVSVEELTGWLRDGLGQVTRVSGEVVRGPAGLQITARSGAADAQEIQGPEVDLDGLIGQAAEALYRQTQPYRYGVYLASLGRHEEAAAVFASLAKSGPAEDRPWAYAGWASILQGEGRHYDAIRMARAAIALDPKLDPPYQILGVSSDAVGRWEVGFDNPGRELAVLQDRSGIGRPAGDISGRVRFLKAVEAFYDSDFQTTTTLLGQMAAFDLEGRAGGYLPQHLRARALSLLHEITAAERAEAGPMDTNSYQAIPGRGTTLGDWAQVAARLEQGRGDPELGGDSQRTIVAPLLAQAYAHLGRLEEAKALIAGAPLDCYRCLEVRADIAGLERDWPAADHWFADLDRQSPHASMGPSEWAASLLSRGDLDGAIAKATLAHKRSPRFADPLETWGEALARKGDYAGAASMFAQAAERSPRWGHNHLVWGDALLRLGHGGEARNHYLVAASLDLSSPDRAMIEARLAGATPGKVGNAQAGQ